MTFLNDIRITTKTFGGFGAVLLLLLLIGGGAIFALSSANDTFTRYRELARQSNAFAIVTKGMMETRIAVKDFLIRGDRASFDRVLSAQTGTIDAAEAALELVRLPERREILVNVETGVTDYETKFETVVEYQAKRDELVKGTLDVLGPEMRKKLTQVMESAYRDNDIAAAFYAGSSQEHLLLARLYVSKFLITNGAGDYERALEEFDVLDDSLAKLMAELQNPTRRRLTSAVIEEIETYRTTFAQVHDIIVDRNAVVTGQLDVIGPQVMEAAAELSGLAKAEQDKVGPRASAFMQKVVVIVMASVAVSLLLGAAAAWFIGTGIARPIGAMAGAMRRLADADKTVEIPGVGQNDEIGEMAEAV
ncbi:HAMP domain-containing protein, partial [Algihabitans albus]|uniref:HAMP domain-containing protein n=1 Tax=Algihabitans albus TaxID=2164067 RepID=UPI0013C2D916